MNYKQYCSCKLACKLAKILIENQIIPAPKLDYSQLLYNDLGISHLCHNGSCVKIEHLHEESHADNMARIGCPGWLQFGSYTGSLVSACTRTPHCIEVTRMPDFRAIAPTQVDQ